jgi:hypothetical protein
MIKVIIDLLNVGEFYGVSEDIDIAKGKYKLPYSWKELKEVIKRNWKSKN